MLKCKIKRGGVVRVKGGGTAEDLMVETGALVSELYRGIKRKSPEAADKFKHALIGLLLAPNSPVWKEG